MQPADQHIFRQFQTMIETTMHVGDNCVRDIIAAADKIASALVAGHTIFSCSDRSSTMLAEIFASYMQHGYEIERPGFPAINVNHIACNQTGPDRFAQTLRTHGSAGDILVVVSPGNNSMHLIHAVEAAIERGMIVILLAGPGDEALSSTVSVDDIQINAAEFPGQQVTLAQFLILQAICGLIDRIIFGVIE